MRKQSRLVGLKIRDLAQIKPKTWNALPVVLEFFPRDYRV